MATTTLPLSFGARLAAFASLCKPRVNSLIVFTAMIGMALASPEAPPLGRFAAASLGIALVAGAAAAINCLLERTVDGLMARTRRRPTVQGTLAPGETLAMALATGGFGLAVLHAFVNDLTLWLTVGTFLGYAVVYTLWLKPTTPMNIVIGGAAGAMPPLLGWTAMTGEIAAAPLSLVLIIFLWTPPHFWSLACYRRDDYARAGLPMLPITHGIAHTCRQILVYTLLLSAASLLPAALGLAGGVYLVVVAVLDLGFIAYALGLCRRYSDTLARRSFRYSIVYLTLLFAALFADRLFA